MTQYEITREEVREIMAALSDIKNTLGRLEEREVARDDRVSRVEVTATQARDAADEAKEMSRDNEKRILHLEQNLNSNNDTIGRWQDLVFRVGGTVVAAGIVGLVGYFIGSGGP